jgi:hypothetical protein
MPNPFTRLRSDRRAVGLDNRLRTEQPFSPNNTREAADPASTTGRTLGSLDRSCELVFGRIVDAIAYSSTYKVQCDRIGGIVCCDLAQTSLTIIGAKQLNTYSPGTRVIVLWHQQIQSGVIIGSVPDWLFDSRSSLSDYVAVGSNVGLQVDAVHKFPFQLLGGWTDYSGGRPADSLPIGQWGCITGTGSAFFSDEFMSCVRLDEESGLFLFHFDQFVRLWGHNLELGSSGFERQDLDDEQEFSSCQGYSPYLWEVMGLFDQADTAYREFTAQQSQQDTPYRGRYEPLYDDQLGMHRERLWHGYLGQGGKRALSVPFADDSTTLVQRYSDIKAPIGLAEENWALDGTIGIRSAGGIYIAKMPVIPQPKRTRRPEDSSGDSAAKGNYASCGFLGGSPDHKVQEEPTIPVNPSTVAPAVLMDQLAYVFNWKGLHPFFYHALDWYLPDESDMMQADVLASGSITFGDLSTSHNLPAASTYEVDIDERYGLVEYYANYSAIALLPHGGVVIKGGWGEEIRIAGGHIQNFAPGDHLVATGRSIVGIAGWDVCMRANNCADISANVNNVRIQANNKVMISGGNNDCGGVLIESRASYPAFKIDDPEDYVAGIVLLAKDSAVVSISKDVVVSTADYGGTGGHFILDAGDVVSITTRSYDFIRHVGHAAVDDINGTINEFWPSITIISTDLIVNGASYLWGCVAADGNVNVNGAVGASSFAYSDTTSFGSVDDIITGRNLTSEMATSLTEVEALTANTDVADLDFYFRSDAQYLTTGLTLVEPLWQQQARLSGESLPVWTENLLVSLNHGTNMAYPGLDSWTTNEAYGQQDLNLFDWTTQIAVDRGGDYETPVEPDVSWVNFDGTWPVIVMPT